MQRSRNFIAVSATASKFKSQLNANENKNLAKKNTANKKRNNNNNT